MTVSFCLHSLPECNEHQPSGQYRDGVKNDMTEPQTKLGPTKAHDQDLFLSRASLSAESTSQGTNSRPHLGGV